MFARTPRLTLRPGWPEDAPALAAAIGHESVVTKLSKAPWPYREQDARDFLALPFAPGDVRLLICAHAGSSEPRLIGGIALDAARDSDCESAELGYWLTPDAWGRGYATEAGRAVVDIARYALPFRRLTSGWFVDNPASGHVLAKLGFRPAGRQWIGCVSRGHPVEAVRVELDLDPEGDRLRDKATDWPCAPRLISRGVGTTAVACPSLPSPFVAA
jgi:RimJ/RimL family protein N-acetyltransferase